MRLERKGIQLLPSKAPLLGDHLGGDPLGHETVCIPLHDQRAEGQPWTLLRRHAHGNPRHGLDAGRDNDVVGPGHDALGSEMGRLLG